MACSTARPNVADFRDDQDEDDCGYDEELDLGLVPARG
jgi:hypothetical protein